MYDFNYIRAESLAAATEALKQVPEAKPLAGGMTLIPTLKLRLAQPAALIDLNAIAELRGIRVDKGRITIRAMSRHADVAESAEIRRVLPALAALAGGIGDAQVRNRGTLGGSIANNDPAADYPAAVLGLAATIRTQWREIPAEQFFTGMFSTALKPGELIKEVVFPIAKRAGYAKFPNPASRYAMVGVMVADLGSEIRVAVTGAGPGVFRATAIEQALARSFSPAALDGIKIVARGLNNDLHGTAEYRAHLIVVMARRAAQSALAG